MQKTRYYALKRLTFHVPNRYDVNGNRLKVLNLLLKRLKYEKNHAHHHNDHHTVFLPFHHRNDHFKFCQVAVKGRMRSPRRAAASHWDAA
jgi:hypothetical protein